LELSCCEEIGAIDRASLSTVVAAAAETAHFAAPANEANLEQKASCVCRPFSSSLSSFLWSFPLFSFYSSYFLLAFAIT
jgi:hypothetical protein